MMTQPDDVEALVRRYDAVVGDLASTRADLEPLLRDTLVVVEHPDPVSPAGTRRDEAASLDGFDAGKTLLDEQASTVHEVLVAGERAAVRATWTGRVGEHRLTSHVASFLAVRDERVIDHETFDCSEETR